MKRLLLPLLFIQSVLLGQLLAADATGQSVAIKAVEADLHHLQKWNDMRGDSADPFWADDDNLYHFTCDGAGFGKASRNLCFNKLTGASVETLRGSLVNSMDEYGKNDETGPDKATWKACSSECIDGVFYAFVARNVYGKSSKDKLLRQTSFNTSLIKSVDRGLTWTRNAKQNYDDPMWPGPRFGGPGFIHYGKNGGQVSYDQADKYVYAVSNNGFWNGGDDLILARIARADLPKLNPADWRYYQGGDGQAEAAWSAKLSEAKPILEQPAKLGWTAPVFIPSLSRYLLVSWYVTPTLKKWFERARVVYDFYEAAHPWGPWSMVSTMDDRFLGEGRHMYGPNLCAKYQELVADGVKIDLYTSGCPFEDKPNGLYKNWRIPLIVKTNNAPKTTAIKHNDPAIRYTGTWVAGNDRPFGDATKNDEFQFSRTSGDAVDYSFSGTGIEVYAEKFGTHGGFEVFVDGKSSGKIGLRVENFDRLSRICVFRADNLPAGRHSIRLVNTGSDYVTLAGFAVLSNEK